MMMMMMMMMIETPRSRIVLLHREAININQNILPMLGVGIGGTREIADQNLNTI